MDARNIISCFLSRALLAIFLLGCGQGAAEPPKILADRSACNTCKMLISDTRFAAAFAGKEPHMFDDIGCMLSALVKLPQQPQNIWVRDYETDTWLGARSAVYLEGPKINTPMNYGFIAVHDLKRAEKLAPRVGGRILTTWNDLVSAFNERM